MAMPSRLELHRINYHHQAGIGVELLRVFDLDKDELRQLNFDVFTEIKQTGAFGDEYYDAYVKILMSWGVMCPHPQKHRLYSGRQTSDFSLTNHKWFLCRCCLCHVINVPPRMI